ncbi:unnamed protein product, partial [Phaeothamnion confervicola]
MAISALDWCRMSDYQSTEAATILLRGVRRDTAPNGLLVVPALSEKGVKGAFTLEVHSDRRVEVQELPETSSKTVAGEWAAHSAGGSHLQTDTWKTNPCYFLKIRTPGVAVPIRITLSRPERDWRAACAADTVGCMMGFYLMRGTRPARRAGAVTHEGRPWDESPFVPTHAVSTPAGFVLDGPPVGDEAGGGGGGGRREEVYTIMPATLESGKLGPFLISVVSDADFSLKRDNGTGGSGM